MTNSIQSSDLILRLVGGNQNGSLFPVSTKKCLISQTVDGAAGKIPECAIFRGKQGVAIRSYMGQMIVNGDESEVHWLQQGDQVKLESTCFVVEQLGSFDEVLLKSDLSASNPQPAQQDSTPTETPIETPNPITPAVQPIAELPAESTTDADPIQPNSAQLDDVMARLERLRNDESPAVEQSPLTAETSEPISQQSTPTVEETRPPAVESAEATATIPGPENDLEAALARLQASGTTSDEVEVQAKTQAQAQTQAQPEPKLQPLDSAPEAPAAEMDPPGEDLAAALAKLQQAQGLTESPAEPTSETQSVSPIELPSTATEFQPVAPEQNSPLQPESPSTPEFNMEEMMAQLENSAPQASSPEALDVPVESPIAETTAADIAAFNPGSNLNTTPQPMERTIDPTLQSEWDSIEGTSPTSLFGIPETTASPSPTEFSEPSSTAPISSEPTSPESVLAESVLAESTLAESGLLNPTDTLMSESPINAQPEETQQASKESRLDSQLNAIRNAFRQNDAEADVRTAEAHQKSVDSENEMLAEAKAQLLNDIGIPVSQEEAPTPAASIDETPISEPPAEHPTTEAPKNESVADVLARMQANGETSFQAPDEDETFEGAEPSGSVLEPVVAPAEPQPMGETGEEDVDVDDYMNQLFNRLRGGPDESGAASASKPKPKATPKPAASSKESAANESFAVPAVPEHVPPADPLTAETFKPSKVAPKRDLSKMRELANSTSRTAVSKSNAARTKAMKIMQISLAVGGAALAGILFMSTQFDFTQTNSLFGIASLIAAGFAGYRFFKTNPELANTSLVKHNPVKNPPLGEDPIV